MAILNFNGAAATLTRDPVRQFYGTSGRADTLSGTSGADGFWGGDGDLMIGGAGDDTYYLKVPRDQIVELAGGGVDRIVSWMSVDLSQYANVENLSVSGSGLSARGNELDNIIEGGAGSQTLYGGRGLDILIGGRDPDAFVVIKGEGNDVIKDFNATEDKVKLTSNFQSFTDLQPHLSQVGADVQLDLGGGDALLFRNLDVGALGPEDFVFNIPATPSTPVQTANPVIAPPSPVTSAVVATGGPLKADGAVATTTRDPLSQIYGTAGRDDLVGTAKAEGLWGGAGDSLTGGEGDDTYYLKVPTDTVVEVAGGGVDRIVSWMSVDLARFSFVENLSVTGNGLYARGNDLDNIIESGAGSQEIYGGKGLDLLSGGSGGDTFVVVKGEGDDAIADFNVAEDKIRLTSDLKSFVDVVSHSSQVGADVRVSLGGPDSLVLRNINIGQLRSENFDFGGASGQPAPTSTAAPSPVSTPAPAPIDASAVVVGSQPSILLTDYSARSSGPVAHFQQAQSIPNVIETASSVASLYGKSGVADTLTGTSKAESLWGGDADRLVGGGGDDTYYMKSAGDKIIEAPGQGTDLIISWMNVDLKDYPDVENLVVNGDGLYAAGNDASNIIKGGGGAQEIYGGLGQDVLSGGAGRDTFLVVKGQGNDAITDFNVAEDRVRLTAGLTSFEQVKSRLSQEGANARLDLGDGSNVLFNNVNVDSLTAQNFQLQVDMSKLGKLTFADEFSGNLSIWDKESNPTGVWRPDFGYQGTNGAGSYALINNGEKQIYTSPFFRGHNGDFSESPFTSNSDGTLSITAQQSSNSELFGYGYTSGLITTKESFSQTYGYFEMRADVPDAAGAWPAFWMLPKSGAWPPELDIMEVLSKDSQATHTTVHSGVGGHTSDGSTHFTPDTADGMHTYGVAWTPSVLVWYVDQVEVFRSPTPADMNQPMFMLANMALGGWGGGVDNSAMPAEFKIDYIKAYELPAGYMI